jgi:hypothetical protein
MDTATLGTPPWRLPTVPEPVARRFDCATVLYGIVARCDGQNRALDDGQPRLRVSQWMLRIEGNVLLTREFAEALYAVHRQEIQNGLSGYNEDIDQWGANGIFVVPDPTHNNAEDVLNLLYYQLEALQRHALPDAPDSEAQWGTFWKVLFVMLNPLPAPFTRGWLAPVFGRLFGFYFQNHQTSREPILLAIEWAIEQHPHTDYARSLQLLAQFLPMLLIGGSTMGGFVAGVLAKSHSTIATIRFLWYLITLLSGDAWRGAPNLGASVRDVQGAIEAFCNAFCNAFCTAVPLRIDLVSSISMEAIANRDARLTAKWQHIFGTVDGLGNLIELLCRFPTVDAREALIMNLPCSTASDRNPPCRGDAGAICANTPVKYRNINRHSPACRSTVPRGDQYVFVLYMISRLVPGTLEYQVAMCTIDPFLPYGVSFDEIHRIITEVIYVKCRHGCGYSDIVPTASILFESDCHQTTACDWKSHVRSHHR